MLLANLLNRMRVGEFWLGAMDIGKYWIPDDGERIVRAGIELYNCEQQCPSLCNSKATSLLATLCPMSLHKRVQDLDRLNDVELQERPSGL
jgi:hypothetical protein